MPCCYPAVTGEDLRGGLFDKLPGISSEDMTVYGAARGGGKKRTLFANSEGQAKRLTIQAPDRPVFGPVREDNPDVLAKVHRRKCSTLTD